MTLLRQIMLVVITIFLILFGINFVLTVYDSRLYLESQMHAHAQDTATSLGLSMTTAIKEQDSANLELLANAVFDRGYYQRITLYDLENTVLISRNNPLQVDGVPPWFVNLIDLPSPVGKAEIMDGWNIMGTLMVIAHPGHAYRDLWRITVDYFYLFCFITILSYGFIGTVLRFLMQPLKRVEQQANDICDRKFSVLDRIPRTRELRQVVEAMNHMSVKIKEMFQRQVQLTESIREEARLDPVTGLINRKEFDALVTGVINSEPGPGSSTLMMLQIRHFSEINTSLGRQQADELLKLVAERFANSLASIPDAIISRRAGADFAVYIPRINLERARAYLQATFQSVASLQFFTTDDDLDRLHMGASFHGDRADLSLMLSAADMALRNAQNEGANGTYFLIHGDSENPVSDFIKQAGEWRQTLDNIIASENLLIHFQPIYSIPDRELIADEVFVRIELDGRIIDAGVFMPMAERFGMLVQLDRLIISKVFQQINESSPSFMINLSTHSIQDESFIAWLTQTVSQQQDIADKVIFEFQEYSVHLAYNQVKQLIDTASPMGYRFSIDRFGSGSTAFSYLQSLDVHFIKIDRSFVAGISENTDNQFFIQSVSQIARTRDMRLIAEGVELDSELDTLTELGVDAAMGYLLGRPGPDF